MGTVEHTYVAIRISEVEFYFSQMHVTILHCSMPMCRFLDVFVYSQLGIS